MPSRDYYLKQAKLLLDLAAQMSAKDDAARLIARANDYQMLAAAMPDDQSLPPVQPPSSVQQPMQQQQQQAHDSKPKDE
jgi:hypothetical protein